jgi:hypothetical protein
MAMQTKSASGFDRDDVTFFWSGGRNVTWRMTHQPTGIFVEASTQLTKASFTKKRLRMAEETLKAKLLRELEQKVLRHPAHRTEAR